ncbi:hypothetical protein Tco_1275565 [Tanacetum coccineum]
MFESGSYKSLPKHIALYEALEASMARAQRDELLAEKDKLRKQRRDDQDPPPPPDSDLISTAYVYLLSSSKQQSGPHVEQPVEDIPIPDSATLSDSEDTDSDHLPKTKQRPEWLKPIPEDKRPATSEPAWVIPSSHIPDAQNIFQVGSLSQDYITDQIDWANPEGDQVRIDINRPLPLSVTPVRTHMRILSVVRIQAYSRYGYDYLKEIVLRRADYQEYTIAEKNFKNLYPNDFEDLNLLLLQGHLNHLSGSDKRMLSTMLNLTKLGWDAKGYEYKHDYTIIDSPRVVVFPVRNNERKIMRFNEIYKFSNETLTNILEALDYRVKEFKVNRLNSGTSSHDPARTGGSTQGHPLDSVEVHRYDKRRKSKNKGIVSTNMDLELEQTQQGSSHEFSVSTEGVEE